MYFFTSFWDVSCSEMKEFNSPYGYLSIEEIYDEVNDKLQNL